MQDAPLVHIMNFKKKLIHLLEKKYHTKIIFYIDNSQKNDSFKIEMNHSTQFGAEENAYSKNLIKNYSEEKEEAETKTSRNLFKKIFNFKGKKK